MPLPRTVTDPDGREVVIDAAGWSHVLERHPELAGKLELVVATIHAPDHREDDLRPGRERFFRRGLGAATWLRVVVRYERDMGRLVTAFFQREEPGHWG